jgi:dTDP-4-amino-4,6-dideoxygalactose transaminase
MGQVAKDFEFAFADRLGVKHAIAVNSGTAAMHLAHHAFGVGPGDEVICPSLTFVATSSSVMYTGAKPVFADIASLDDLTISPEDIESKIDVRTKGIVVMHYAGFPCDMDRIMEIARRHGLFVVEDAAHAPGAVYYSKEGSEGSGFRFQDSPNTIPNGEQRTVNGERQKAHGKRLPASGERTTANGQTQKVGSIGDIGCFSFFSNKNMTTGEGGMVVTNRDDLAERIRIARSHGMTTLTWDRHTGHAFSYDVVESGFNYRIDELRASLGLVQLEKLDKNNEKRRSLDALYRELLDGVEEINLSFSSSTGTSSCHIFPVLPADKVDRKDLMGYLRGQGIQTSIHYPPVHLFSFYRKALPVEPSLPRTEEIGQREVTLPLYPTMKEEQVDYVVDCIKDYLSR